MLSSKTRVGVLRGGPSNQYETSLASGHNILSILRSKPDQYEPLDIFISKDGEWHVHGLVESPLDILRRTDVAFNTLHGTFGEDGEIQKILERHSVPYTGSSIEPSLFAMDKVLSKKAYRSAGLLTPTAVLVTLENINEDILPYIFKNLLQPLVIKPVQGSGSEGIRIANTFPELTRHLEELLNIFPQLIVEEYVRGREVSCVVLEGARGQELYAFLPVEVQTKGYQCPGNFSAEVSKEVEKMAKAAHSALGQRHYSHSDFIVTSKGKSYILETNSQPKFSENSALLHSLYATGWKPEDFVEHVISLALKS